MIQSGLVSITFRNLSPSRIVDLAAQAGIGGIEWGGDVHVPHGEVDLAREVSELTRAKGLEVAAYGSYYRAAQSEEQGLSFERVLNTALALGAPLIRVWPGCKASANADAEYRKRVVDDLARISTLAGQHDLRVACEYHGGSLTDSSDAAVKLMQDIANPNAGLYWQPPVGMPPDECVAALQAALPFLTHLHVFHWSITDGSSNRRPRRPCPSYSWRKGIVRCWTQR